MKQNKILCNKNGIKLTVALLLKKLFLASPVFLLLPYTAVYATIESNVETVNCDLIKGWIWDSTYPSTRFRLDIVDLTTFTPVKLATLTAQQYRLDLFNAGKGDGKYGFAFILPASIRDAKKHNFAVRLNGTTIDLTNSPQLTLGACYGKLNDTGINTCSDSASNGLECPVPGYAGQDGDYGRDATNNLAKKSEGRAGFDYTKIANDGSVLPATASRGTGAKDWACTRDNVTGLVWEIKTDNGGLRDKDNTYSWYNADNASNGGFAGYQNGGSCSGHISCDTQAYVKKINELSLCGSKYSHPPTAIPTNEIMLHVAHQT